MTTYVIEDAGTGSGSGGLVVEDESIELSEGLPATSSPAANMHQVPGMPGVGQEVVVVTLDQRKLSQTRPNPVTPKPPLLRHRAKPPSLLRSPAAKSASARFSGAPGPSAASAASQLPPASAGFIQRNTFVTIPQEDRQFRHPQQQQWQTVQMMQQGGEGDGTVQEIVLWEPDTEDCEIMEVDEAQLEELFLQRQHQHQQPMMQMLPLPSNGSNSSGHGEIQQIIVCDGENVPFANFLQSVGYYASNNQQGHGQISYEIVQQPQIPVTSASVRRQQQTTRVPKIKAEKKKPTTDIKCLEEDCTVIVHNVIDLRKHLQDEHHFDFEEEVTTFASDEDFKNWRTSYERDQKVSFIYRGGTKKISAEKAVTYLICHRSGHYKPTVETPTERKRKLKPQGSCKIGTHCTAGIKLLKNLTTGVVGATICHTHYGHDNANIQHLRINSSLKTLILDKLKEGFSFRQLLEYVHHNPDGLQGMGVVDRRAIRNIFDQWRRTNTENNDNDDADDNDNAAGAGKDPLLDDTESDAATIPATCDTTNELQEQEQGSAAPESDSDQKNRPEKSISSSPRVVKVKVEVGDGHSAVTNSDKQPATTSSKKAVVESSSSSTTPTPTIKQENSRATATTTRQNKSTARSSRRKRKISDETDDDFDAETAAEAEVLGSDDEDDDEIPKKSTAKPSKAKSRGSGAKGGAKRRQANGKVIKEPPEDVHTTIQKLLKHGDSGPTVLFYKKSGQSSTEYGAPCPTLVRKDDLCIVLQTPIQRQLLQSNGSIVNVEVVEGFDMDLMVMSILDEFMCAVPAAWMIAGKMTPALMEHCFRILKTNCGSQLSCQYLITLKKNEGFARLWAKVFQRRVPPQLILSQEDTLKELRTLIRRHLDGGQGQGQGQEKKGQVFVLVEEMVTSPDQLVFEQSFAALKEAVGAESPDFIKALSKDWLPIRGQWAFHARTQIHTAVEEAFMRLRKFILFKGTKKMRANVHNILKIGYDRCFQRSKSLVKGDLKLQLAVDEIRAKHGGAGVVEKIGGGSNKFLVDGLFEVYDLDTACCCRVRCELCQVCMHNYWCSCGERNFCVHAHTVRQFTLCGDGGGHRDDRNRDRKNFIVKSEEDLEDDHDDPDQGCDELSDSDTPEDVQLEEYLAATGTDSPARPNDDDDEFEEQSSTKKETMPSSPIASRSPSRSRSTSQSPEPELIVPDADDEPAVRTSARILSRRKGDKSPEKSKSVVKRARGRPRKTDDVEQPSCSSSSSSPPKQPKFKQEPESTKNESRSPARRGAAAAAMPTATVSMATTRSRKESVRDELLGLLGQLDSIHDARVMTEVKKRVSDISAVVTQGLNGQI